MRIYLLLSLLAVMIVALPGIGQAGWTNDPSVNTPVFTGPSSQTASAIVPDGQGGAIIISEDHNFGHQNINAQRLDSRGEAKWGANGILFALGGEGGATEAHATSDGSGGAIIVWKYNLAGNMDLYAQRLNASGNSAWGAAGVAISTAAGTQEVPRIITDGSGGAIIVWQDSRGAAKDIYAQRVDASGVPQWTANGVVVSNAAGDQTAPVVAPDGSGGAVVAWLDMRNAKLEIFAQRLNASGTAQWTANGVAVSTAAVSPADLRITGNNSGGAIISWSDARSGNSLVYAQKLNASGVGQLAADGAVLASSTFNQYYPRITSDGSGGAIVVWTDYRNGDADIYAQKINSSNTLVWTASGKPVSTVVAQVDDYPILAPDGSGGAVVSWLRVIGPNKNIYAQHIGTGGNVTWPPDGVAITTAPDSKWNAQILGIDGGAVIAWADFRSAAQNDVYAQRIMPNGILPAVYDPSVNVSLTCPASVTAGSNFNVTVNLTNEDCTAGVSVSRFSKMMVGNAGGTLSGLGVSGPVNSALAKTVPAANCTSWPIVSGTAAPFNLQVTAPPTWGGKAARVTIEAVNAQGLSLGAGECMVPVQ